MSKRLVISSLSFVLLFTLLVFAQQKTGTIKGRIIDEDTKEPLIGVNILIEYTTLGVATDVEGDYLIVNVQPGFYKLIVSYIGYESKNVDLIEVNPKVGIEVNVGLKANYKKLNIVLRNESFKTNTIEEPLAKQELEDLLDSSSPTVEDAMENIKNNDISIYLGSWLYISDSLRALSNKFGFEPIISGCLPRNTEKYDSVMIDYLKTRNGDNWYEEFLSEWDELKKYEQENFKEIIEEVKFKCDR